MYLWTFKIGRCCWQNKMIFSLGLFCLPKCNAKYLKISWRHGHTVAVSAVLSISCGFELCRVEIGNYRTTQDVSFSGRATTKWRLLQLQDFASSSPVSQICCFVSFLNMTFCGIPPPLISENHIVFLSPNFMLKKACLKVQNLQYNFLDWKRAPHPFPKIHPF